METSPTIVLSNKRKNDITAESLQANHTTDTAHQKDSYLCKMMELNFKEMRDNNARQLKEFSELRDALNIKLDGINTRAETTNAKVDKNSSDISYLRRRQNEADQDRLATHMEISGLTHADIESNKDKLTDYVIEICLKYGLRTNKSAIQRVYTRDVTKRDPPKRLLVVIFTTPEVKYGIMKGKRESADNKDGIFFDNCMTAFTRALYMESRKVAKIIDAKSAFIRNGRIFISFNTSDKPLKINSFEELEKLKNERTPTSA